MTRPLSQLLYSIVQEGNGSPFVMTMHDYNQFGKDVAEWGLAASPKGRVLALESYKGVFIGHSIVGYTWFLGPATAPSPIYFGDSLAEIERFLWDEMDRADSENPERPVLLGVGQGSIMAIATALAVPDLISGVIAIDAFLPRVPGWNPPLAPMNNIPILLINPKESDHPQVLCGNALVEQLRSWGADVQMAYKSSLTPDTLDVSGWMAQNGAKKLVQ